MAIEEKQVVIYHCDGCDKKTVVADGEVQPRTGIVGNVVLGHDGDVPVTTPWYAHSNRCIRAAVEAASDVDFDEALRELTTSASPSDTAAASAGAPVTA